ncbi:class I adenylate-forming enzyme family protein [Mangrovihabitans endophyticus]|uniref:AMP-dependent synthetase n=1 Tax=Mangrovihabitans endophyticus TaxID=1751298 RepID=A0A8J3FML3_9ACTN|nr:fatty acid--CoA ligase family protein [Mangrovihabitans endophyticus]GGK80323.1 AMP-dependent synthetase [Mangrovihabitans endophyticus]
MRADAPGAGGVWPQPVLDLLAKGGDRPVFEHGARVLSAAQMSALIGRCAAGLRASGVRPGDGVELRLGVTPEAFAVIVAAFAVGACVSGGGGLAGHGGLVVDEARLAALVATPAPPDEPLIAAGRLDDMARVIHTSGSTGRPKGCAQTYAAMSAAWAAHPDRWPPAIRELASRLHRFLVFGSLSSQVMLEYATLSLAAGGTLVVADPPGFPDAIVRHRASASVITVGKLNKLVRGQRALPADLSSLQALMVSGSPLPAARLAEALDVLGPVVFHGYGQTETGMIAMLTPQEMRDSPAALFTVGHPPPGVDVSIRDGELYVRTPAQASLYLDDPAESADVFVDDGWVRTRDLAELDERGRLRLVGRARDVIIVQAQLVYAGAVERVLTAAPDVAEAYVVGRPDDDTGEAVHAFVVPARGCTPDAGILCAHVAAELGPAAAPQTVTFIDDVPVARSGKPDKSALSP